MTRPAADESQHLSAVGLMPLDLWWQETRHRLLLGLMMVAYLPFILPAFGHLWQHEEYQFFPLALIGASLLAWRTLREFDARNAVDGGSAISTSLSFISGLLLIVACVLKSPFLGMISGFVLLGAGIYALGGWRLSVAMIPTALLLLTVLPLPLEMDTWLTTRLRSLAVNVSSVALDILHVIHVRSGNILEIPGHRLFVEDACSGINSLLSTTACGLFYITWRRMSLFRCTVTMLGIVGFVLAGNTFRITAGAWLRHNYNIDLLSGWPHEALGMALFACYLLLILSMDHAMRLFLDAPAVVHVRAPLAASNPIHDGEVRLLRCSRRLPWAAGLAAVIGIAYATPQLLALASGNAKAGLGVVPTEAEAAKLPVRNLSLPEQVGPWKQLKMADGQADVVQFKGLMTKAWAFEMGGVKAWVALDYPFRSYHDVRGCYEKAGWIVASENHLEGTGHESALMEVTMQKDDQSRAGLWCASFDGKGAALAQKPDKDLGLFSRLVGRLKAVDSNNDTAIFQLQALVVTQRPITPAETEAVRDLFRAVRTGIVTQVTGSVKPE